jgi:hydroxypyruvate isomerase
MKAPPELLATQADLTYGQTLGRHLMSQKTPAPRPTTELIRTHAERLAHEAEERLQKRQLILTEQCARENPPEVRIRAWEKAHALCLPSDPGHPVLRAIATCTGLTLAEVQEEQRARRARQNRGSVGLI